jgi:hypothetical protein
MKTKAITALFILLFSISAHAATVESLIKTYGKDAIMEVIASKIGKKFTVYVDNTTQETYLPNTDYITAWTLAADIERAGMTVKSVETKLESSERDKKVKVQEMRIAEEMRKAENEELERQRKIDQQKIRVEEAIRIIAEQKERDRQLKTEGLAIPSETITNTISPNTIEQTTHGYQEYTKATKDVSCYEIERDAGRCIAGELYNGRPCQSESVPPERCRNTDEALRGMKQGFEDAEKSP